MAVASLSETASWVEEVWPTTRPVLASMTGPPELPLETDQHESRGVVADLPSN